jgi:hypothetical protein
MQKESEGETKKTKRIRNKNYYLSFNSLKELSLQWMAKCAAFALGRRMSQLTH